METSVKLLSTIMLVTILGKMVVTLETETTAKSISISQSEYRRSLLDNGISLSLRYLYQQCAESEDIFWCAKVQVAKMLGRALKLTNLNIIDGVSIVQKVDVNETRAGRASIDDHNLSNRDIERLSMKSLDTLVFERFLRFLRSRQVQVNLPRLLSFGQRNGEYFINYIMGLFTQPSLDNESEGRGKKKGDDKKYLGAFIAAVMLKAAILKMAYHSIAILAGKALIVGKIALIISAIIGLKKLVSSEGGEKTTYEIVKHPQVQQSHTYSSSHAGEYEGGHEGGSYHRSIDDELMMQDKAYNAWVPTTKVT